MALAICASAAFGTLASCADNAPRVTDPAGSAGAPTAFGSQIYEPDDIARSVELLVSLGARYARVSAQSSPAYLDALVAAATAKGLRVILLSAYASQPVDIAAYASATAQLHARYAASNPVWEIWNEPNLAAYWGAAPDVRSYLTLFTATAQALRAAGATDVWTGGTSGVDVNWIYNLATRGAFKLANGCAVHSYKAPGYALTEYIQAVKILPPGVRLHTTETCVPSSSDQSDFFNQMWAIHRQLNVPTFVWCELRDGDAGNVAPYNEAYGLVTGDYQAKSVFAAVRAAIVAER